MVTKIIAIDGPAASGKGTIARRLAAYLNYAHLDTGALYRLVGVRVLETGGDPDLSEDAIAAARWVSGNFKSEMSENPTIRTAEAGNAASKSSVFPEVRQALYDLQVNFAHNPPAGKGGVVLDGRDIGTVICPDADVKLYITASVEERARRRFAELQGKGHDVNFDKVLLEMKERDARDSGRDTAPLKPAEDAIVIDTSDLNADDSFGNALNLVIKFIMP